MIERIDVFANGLKVGILALTKDNKIAFQYDETWLKKGFSISPFVLPLSNKVFIATSPYFRGLFGVFGDSLPDSYGELLLDRYLRQKQIDIGTFTCLDRLAYIGSSGMGMLEYVPSMNVPSFNGDIDFDLIQKECNSLLDSQKVENIDNLYSLGGSSGGARPKSLISFEGEDYIVKFSSKFDPKNIAEIEYNTMLLAKKCGINIPPIRLITTKTNNKYFLIKRFDRGGSKKIHMITASALLECDFRVPCLDYNDLIKLTAIITRNDNDVLEMYRRMVFNVLIDNQDDHAKNFSFIFDEQNKTYRLSPAYDLTPSKTYYLEHTTSINGKGKDITIDDLLAVASKNKIEIKKAKELIESIKGIIKVK